VFGRSWLQPWGLCTKKADGEAVQAFAEVGNVKGKAQTAVAICWAPTESAGRFRHPSLSNFKRGGSGGNMRLKFYSSLILAEILEGRGPAFLSSIGVFFQVINSGAPFYRDFGHLCPKKNVKARTLSRPVLRFLSGPFLKKHADG